MGIILNKGCDEDVIEEFQNCGLYPHDTRKIKKLFLEFRTLRINSMDGKHFGLRMNAQQLTEWKKCSLENAQKLISRWKPTIAVKKSNTQQLLNTLRESDVINTSPNNRKSKKNTPRQKLRKHLSRSFSDLSRSFCDIQKANEHVFNELMSDETEISMLPLFCAMTLLSSGTVSEKLKLIIYLFVNNPHDSVSRKKLDLIVENTISAIIVLLSMKKYSDKIRRNAHRHIYKKNCNNSTTFKQISRGSLAVWLATSPYVLHIFCLRNTSDVTERYKFLTEFYHDTANSETCFISAGRRDSRMRKPSIRFQDAENSYRRSTVFKKSRFENASVPNLATIDSSLRGTHLDFHKEQSIKLTYHTLSKSWSAAQLKRNLIPLKYSDISQRNSKFTRIDSNVSMFSRRSLGDKRKDGAQQYYGGSVPFDSPPVGMDKILTNFNKHYKLALKIQSRIRAPALVNKNNAKSVVDGFEALSGGKETIKREDVLLSGHQSIVAKTLERIFVKCDIKGSHSIDIREFLMSQFGSANDEELDRAMSYNEKMPRVYGWTVQCLKLLFDKIAKEKYGWNNGNKDQRRNSRRTRLFLHLNDNEDGKEKKKEGKIKMCDFYALIIHCKELRNYVIRTTRLRRAKSKQMVTFKEACDMIFKECRGFHPESRKFQILWSWVMKTQPPLNDEQKVQLKLLFDTMEQKADGTISDDQLQNATEWIYPGLNTDSYLPYLFYKFHRKQTQRIDCDDFLYFMGYVWCLFQTDFNRRKKKKLIMDSKSAWDHRFRSSLTPSVASRMSNRFRRISASQYRRTPLSRISRIGSVSVGRDSMISAISIQSSKTNTSRPNTQQTATLNQSVFPFDDEMTQITNGDHAEIIKFAKEVKQSIKDVGDFNDAGLSEKMQRFWSNVLSKANAEQAWIRLVLLSIRMVLDNHKHHEKAKDESIFAYMKVLEHEDHHSDFKNTQFYTVPKA